MHLAKFNNVCIIVNTLDSRTEQSRLRVVMGHCVVLLGETLYSLIQAFSQKSVRVSCGRGPILGENVLHVIQMWFIYKPKWHGQCTHMC